MWRSLWMFAFVYGVRCSLPAALQPDLTPISVDKCECAMGRKDGDCAQYVAEIEYPGWFQETKAVCHDTAMQILVPFLGKTVLKTGVKIDEHINKKVEDVRKVVLEALQNNKDIIISASVVNSPSGCQRNEFAEGDDPAEGKKWETHSWTLEVAGSQRFYRMLQASGGTFSLQDWLGLKDDAKLQSKTPQELFGMFRKMSESETGQMNAIETSFWNGLTLLIDGVSELRTRDEDAAKRVLYLIHENLKVFCNDFETKRRNFQEKLLVAEEKSKTQQQQKTQYEEQISATTNPISVRGFKAELSSLEEQIAFQNLKKMTIEQELRDLEKCVTLANDWGKVEVQATDLTWLDSLQVFWDPTPVSSLTQKKGMCLDFQVREYTSKQCFFEYAAYRQYDSTWRPAAVLPYLRTVVGSNAGEYMPTSCGDDSTPPEGAVIPILKWRRQRNNRILKIPPNANKCRLDPSILTGPKMYKVMWCHAEKEGCAKAKEECFIATSTFSPKAVKVDCKDEDGTFSLYQ